VNNATVTATDVSVQASTAYSLLISPNKTTKEWGTTTKLSSTVGVLTPVSTIGEVLTDTEKYPTGLKLTKATEGNDAVDLVGIGDDTTVAIGDVRFVTNDGFENNFITTVSEISKTSTVDGTNKYFYSDTVWLKAAQDGNIYLDSTGIGIVWAEYDDTNNKLKDAKLTSLATFVGLTQISDDEIKTLPAKADADGAFSAEDAEDYNAKLSSAQELLKTLRIGLLVTQSTTADSKTTYTRTWHEYQLAKNKISDSSTNTTKTGDSTVNGIEYALSAMTSGSPATKSLPVPTATTSKVALTDKTIEDYALAGASAGLANYSSDADLIAGVKANEEVQVDIYIWMEGCDYDTVAANINSFAGAGVTGLQLGFCLGTATSST
jgi:hypothetical protein